jgi:sialidase-1
MPFLVPPCPILHLLLLLLLFLPATTCSAGGKQQQPTLQEIFRSGASSNPWSRGRFSCYRIPSLVTTKDGTLLAFASERLSTHGGCNDDSDTNLVQRRSTDVSRSATPLPPLPLS